MKQSLFFKDDNEYTNYNTESLKPIGFDESLDVTVYDLKIKLFNKLQAECKKGRPSFDPEIFFTSVVSDFNETFDAVAPYLLKIQRESE